MVHPGEVSFGFNFSASMTLPLMGFWNAVIYTTTSWTALKWLFAGGFWRPSTSCCREAVNGITKRRLELPTSEDREDYPPRVIRGSLADRLKAMTVVSTKGCGCVA